MADQRSPTGPAGRRRGGVALGLAGGIVAVLLLLLVLPGVTGGGWGVSRLWSASPATPGAAPTAAPAAPSAQAIKTCIEQAMNPDVYRFYLRDIPADRWGDPVTGKLSTFDEAFTLWLLDADCRPHQAVTVPAHSRRTFEAYVGQVWYWADASSGQPGDGRDSGVISPSHNGADQIFSNTGRLTYDTE